MCGIAGIVRFDDQPVDRAALQAMLRQVQHRGPDGQNLWIGPRCGLAHARLSIIDLQLGSQPMHAPPFQEHGDLTVVFNGEIYNHRNLRRILERFGHSFSSDHSDTEILLHGYRQWGAALPQHLEGMFAFAIWDSGKQSLYLARDRIGKKPLYFHRDNGRLLFGSLVATIFAAFDSGNSIRIDRDALRDYLRLGYSCNASLIEGIDELPPASWATIDAEGRMQVQSYWSLPPVSRTDTAKGVVQAVTELLTTAVERRLESDVPVGCFLSGGIDSSLIAAIAQKLLDERGEPALKTFCVAIPNTNYDESGYAQRVANHVGADHMTLSISSGDDLFGDLRRLVATSGEPTADSSILPTFLLCRAARQHLKVAMAGEGGDELFGGYERYRALRLLSRHRWWLRAIPPRLLGVHDQLHTRARFRRLVEAARQRDAAEQYCSISQLFSNRQVEQLGIAVSPRSTGLPDWPDIADPPKAAMRWDLTHYLPYDLLRKIDRASMAVALEVRCPMLDRELSELAAHLPAAVLTPRGRPKQLLRTIARTMLPAEIVNRRKRGFAIPIGRWFAGDLAGPLRDVLPDDRLESLGLAEAPVREMLEAHTTGRADHTHRLFALLSLSLWKAWLDESVGRSGRTPPVSAAG